jgi:hypothetical protein
MAHGDRTRFLHVANGSCTTRLIELAGIPGVRSIWADPLYEGPVPSGLNDRELMDVRRQFLGGTGGSGAAAWDGPDCPLGPVNDLREWRAAIERHDSYDELILWFEHDLFDQLNLVQLLTWIHEHLPSSRRVSLIGIGSFPGRPDFSGLGALAPDELASLIGTRRDVTREQFEIAERAWLAFRAPSPEGLDLIRRGETPALPYLAPALARFLQEYPWTRDGLSRTERRLLELAAGGDTASLQQLFPHMHDGEQAYYVTDASLAALAESLARADPPLLTLDVSFRDAGGTLRGRVALTGAGRSVLSGDLDRVAACGIDRWLGGVHLQRGAPLWRWDEAAKHITAGNL